MTTAVVTGGGGEIGAAICHRLAADGWHVVVCDVELPAAEAVAESLTAAGHAAESLRVDVTGEGWATQLVDQVVARHGCLRVFVHSVGIEGAVRPLQSYPADVFERVMQVNAASVFHGMRAALPVMYEAGTGVIVNIASTSGIRGRKNLAGYVASKHAVLGLTKAAAVEAVGTGVRVNAVLPGPVAGRMTHAINEGQATGETERAVAAPYGNPADVAATVAYLVDPQARHLNGAEVVVDGGATIA